jgi:hypothetical protein
LDPLSLIVESYFISEAWNTFYSTDADATTVVNNVGYQAGTTRFRSLQIRDGKTAAIATFNGSSKQVDFAGAVVIGDNSGTDSVTMKQGAATTASAAPSGTVLTLEQAAGSNAYLTFRQTDAQKGFQFANSSGSNDGFFVYNGSRSFLYGTAGTVRQEIDVNGQMFVGDTTNTAIADGTDALTIGNSGTGTTSDLTLIGTPTAQLKTTGDTSINFDFNNGSDTTLTLDNAGAGAFALSVTGPVTATRITPATQLFDHTRGFEIFNEFLNVPTEATLTGAGSYTEYDHGFTFLGGWNGTNAEANRPGLLTLRGYNSTDTLGGSAAPRYARVITGEGGTGDSWFAGGGETKVAGAFYILSAFSPPVDDSDSYTIHIGLFDSNTQTGATADFAPNGIYCRVGSSSANVQVCTSEADVQSCTDTSPTIAIAEDAWYRCEFTVNAAGTQVDFTVTNVTATTSGTASRTTNIPNDSTHPVGLGMTLDTVDAAGTGLAYLDYLWMDQTFTTAR